MDFSLCRAFRCTKTHYSKEKHHKSIIGPLKNKRFSPLVSSNAHTVFLFLDGYFPSNTMMDLNVIVFFGGAISMARYD